MLEELIVETEEVEKLDIARLCDDEDHEFKIESESFSETDELKIQHVVNKRDDDLRNTGYAITGIAIGIAGVVTASVVTIKKIKNKEEIVIEDK